MKPAPPVTSMRDMFTVGGYPGNRSIRITLLSATISNALIKLLV